MAAAFLAIALVWIFASDWALAYFIDDPALMTKAQNLKGGSFVIVTGMMVFFLSRNALRKRDQQLAFLESERKRFQVTFDDAPVGISHMTLDLRYTWVNRAQLALTPLDIDALEQHGPEEVTHPLDWERELPELEQLRRGEINHYSIENASYAGAVATPGAGYDDL
ncbi:hypothetical protein [Alkalilimnicola ehrlichii]|uniref:hypothetical protein n=1 Tax=Alkalilimnicola ehrlichii TaxID=351052 RepID=UPI0011C0720F|nr:hypothetical protein [Alkalilimnicola ehrlichii]